MARWTQTPASAPNPLHTGPTKARPGAGWQMDVWAQADPGEVGSGGLMSRSRGRAEQRRVAEEALCQLGRVQ